MPGGLAGGRAVVVRLGNLTATVPGVAAGHDCSTCPTCSLLQLLAAVYPAARMQRVAEPHLLPMPVVSAPSRGCSGLIDGAHRLSHTHRHTLLLLLTCRYHSHFHLHVAQGLKGALVVLDPKEKPYASEQVGSQGSL